MRTRLRWLREGKVQSLSFRQGLRKYKATIEDQCLTVYVGEEIVYKMLHATNEKMKKEARRILKQHGVRFFDEVRKVCLK